MPSSFLLASLEHVSDWPAVYKRNLPDLASAFQWAAFCFRRPPASAVAWPQLQLLKTTAIKAPDDRSFAKQDRWCGHEQQR